MLRRQLHATRVHQLPQEIRATQVVKARNRFLGVQPPRTNDFHGGLAVVEVRPVLHESTGKTDIAAVARKRNKVVDATFAIQFVIRFGDFRSVPIPKLTSCAATARHGATRCYEATIIESLDIVSICRRWLSISAYQVSAPKGFAMPHYPSAAVGLAATPTLRSST